MGLKQWLTVIIILFSVPVFAQDFTLTSPKNLPVAYQGETKKIELELTSTIKDRFIINIKGIKPWMTLSTSSQPGLNANETESIVIYVEPNLEISPGRYEISVTAESLQTHEKETKTIYISIKKTKKIEEKLEIEDIYVKGDLKPTGNADIKITVKNNKRVTISESSMDMVLKSPSQTVYKKSYTIGRLDPDEQKLIKKNISLNPGTESGTYSLIAKVVYGNESSTKTQAFRVSKSSVITRKEETGLVFFGNSHTIKVKNVGNEEKTNIQISKELGITGYFFWGEKPNNQANGTYSWIFSLGPGEKKIITYSVNYIPLIIIVIIISAIAYYIFFVLKTVRLKKYITKEKQIEENTTFTVAVEINNNTNESVSSTVVRDFIPSIFKVTIPNQGTKPKTKKTESGTELIWRLKELEDGEVRVLSYAIQPVFSVTGKIKLPRAKVRYKLYNEWKEQASNIPALGTKKK